MMGRTDGAILIHVRKVVILRGCFADILPIADAVGVRRRISSLKTGSSLLLIALALALAGLAGCTDGKGLRILNSLPNPILSARLPKTAPVADLPAKPHPERSVPQLSYASVLMNVPAAWYPPVADRDWQVIVIHHSASDVGDAHVFDAAHRARGWDELGYHFVIGNGTGTPDGYVEVGSRWKKQKHGAHCKTPSNYYNEYGIGICLVGNFDESSPSPAQLATLRRLLTFLSLRYHISADRLYGHGEVRGTHTRCPGRHLPMNDLRYWVNCNNPIWASTTR